VVARTGEAAALDGGSAVSGFRGPGITGAVQVSDTGPAVSVGGGIANSGYLVVQPSRQPAPWPHQVGVIPPRAQPFHSREEFGHLRAALGQGGTVVLCSARGHSGAVGKTQLAAEYARSAWEAGDLDVLIWTAAGTRAAVVAGYAQAAAQLLPTDSDDPEQAARELLAWLEPKAAAGACRWLVVLDGVTAPDELSDLWPPAGATGRAIATTRCSESLLDGGHWRLIPIGPYSPSEALAYLTTALAAHGRREPTDELARLADELQCMPAALTQAVSALLGTGLSAVDYRRLLAAEATVRAGAADPAVGDWNRRHGRLRRFRLRHSVALLTRPLRRRGHNAAERHRRAMLRKVFRRADDMASRAEECYIAPTLAVWRGSPAPRGKGSGRRKASESPWQPCDARSLRDLFDRAGEDLVLLSEPGMGKSVQLARLARELAEQGLAYETPTAARPRSTSIPVLVSLSTYRGEPLQEWLAAEINRSYGVPRVLVAEWITANALVPLLDGLDQVPQEYRRECAKQIRRLREHCSGLVVTCRSRDRDLAMDIKAACCARLEPPSHSQILRYLNSAPEAMADVRTALDADPSLWELVKSPLILAVIRHTYADRPATELRGPGTSQQREARILDAYVRRMLERRPSRYSSARTLQWLTWLARTLRDRGEDVLYLDRLDNTWASATGHPRLVKYGPHAGFLALMLGSAAGWLAAAHSMTQRPLSLFGAVAPIVVLSFACAWVGINVAEKEYGRAPVEQVRWSTRVRVRNPRRSPLLRGTPFGRPAVEGFLLGLLIIVAAASLGARPQSSIIGGGLIALFLITFLDWFEPDVVDQRDTPTDGIRRSARHALAFGAARTAATLLLMGPLVTLVPRSLPTQIGWLASALTASLFGLTTAYQYGGLAFLHHWTLRLALTWCGAAPLRYQRFLRGAEQQILVQRVGSGYSFHHALVQQHLAVWGTPTAPEQCPARRQP
jgi:hypothetical protein